MEDSGTNDETFLDLPGEDVRPSPSGAGGLQAPDDEGEPERHPAYGLDRDDRDFEAGEDVVVDHMIEGGGGNSQDRLRESEGMEPPYEQMFNHREPSGTHPTSSTWFRDECKRQGPWKPWTSPGGARTGSMAWVEPRYRIGHAEWYRATGRWC